MTSPAERSGTPRGLYCGYSLAHLEDDILSAQIEAVGEDFQSRHLLMPAMIYEPGGLAYCKHIAFYITDGVVYRHPGGGSDGWPSVGLTASSLFSGQFANSRRPQSPEFRRIGACIFGFSVL